MTTIHYQLDNLKNYRAQRYIRANSYQCIKELVWIADYYRKQVKRRDAKIKALSPESDYLHGRCESCDNLIRLGSRYNRDSEGIVWHMKCPKKKP